LPVRPTTDRAREALFNILHARLDWPDTRVLDAFAGSGAVGLEALSRGAAHVTFWEHHPRVVRHLTATLAELGCSPAEARVAQVNSLVQAATPRPADHPAFDWVFLDPPYAIGGKAQLLGSLRANGWLAPGAEVVLEHLASESFRHTPGFAEERTYGTSRFSFFSFPDPDPDHTPPPTP
jgi:16S rRNA (guanine966-N2)-methyltransferase